MRVLRIAARNIVLIGLITVVLALGAPQAQAVTEGDVRGWAEEALTALLNRYWNDFLSTFNSRYPCTDTSCYDFNYWWQAHAIDALLDGYVLTGDEKYLEYMDRLRHGVLQRNGFVLYNHFYDDMEWMALALLRAYNLTDDTLYLEDAKKLFNDIIRGWMPEGGIAWNKDHQSVNACSNGPAAILAARLYRATGDETYLDWAKKIFAWLDETLVDPRTFLVLDNLHLSTKQIDRRTFTYNQGTYIGAAVELYELTGDEAYLEKAQRTARSALVYHGDRTGVFIQERGQGDGGLFKGIMVRYMVELLRVAPEMTALRDALVANAASVSEVRRDDGLFGPRWRGAPHVGTVDLSTHLSAVMLFALTAPLAD